MALLQMVFDLSPEVMEGLATGAYKLFGGVVRDQAGQIVCFLPEALSIAEAGKAPVQAAAAKIASTATKAAAKTPVAKKAAVATAKKAPKIFTTIAHFAKMHPVGVAVTAVAVVAGAGYGIYRWYRGKKAKETEREITPEYVVRFNTALDAYYAAWQNGTLNETIIDELITAIDNMRQEVASGTVKLEFTADQINNMLGLLSYFTKEFASANNYDYSEPVNSDDDDPCSNLVLIKDYLKIQKEICHVA